LFSPSVLFERENEVVAKDNAKRPFLFTESSGMDMLDNKPGPITQSTYRAKRIIIPESATLTEFQTV
jgi:hypothetical protein